jgi:hypothetical protein
LTYSSGTRTAFPSASLVDYATLFDELPCTLRDMMKSLWIVVRETELVATDVSNLRASLFGCETKSFAVRPNHRVTGQVTEGDH